MSYARMGHDSDVYVIMCINGELQCISCPDLGKGEIWSCNEFNNMIKHLEKHVEDGFRVPDDALRRLKEDHLYGSAEQYSQLEHWHGVLDASVGGSHRAQELRKHAQAVIEAIHGYLRIEIGDY